MRRMMLSIKVTSLSDLNYDIEFGYETYKEGPKRLGWLLNLVNTTVTKEGSPDRSGLECFFIEQNGNLFKATVVTPYDVLFMKMTF